MNAVVCQTCGDEKPKYRCPRCEIRSCSLDCVKAHRMKEKCSGQRDKAQFILKKEYNENIFFSDYSFLEEINRVADNAVRDNKNKLKHFSKHTKVLQRKASEQGITLKLLPVGFSKRKENTTIYHYRSRTIRWRIQLFFPQANAEYTEFRVPENKKFTAVLAKYIDHDHADPVLKQKLKVYHAADHRDCICVFLEDQSSGQSRFFSIDISQTVAEVLKHKLIIEYPTFHVVLPEHVAAYNCALPSCNPAPEESHLESTAKSSDSTSHDLPSESNIPSTSDLVMNENKFGMDIGISQLQRTLSPAHEQYDRP